MLRLILNTEKAMAPHSRTLACKIPWTQEPGSSSSRGQKGLPRWCSGEESTCQCRRCKSWSPLLGRSPGDGHGTQLQYSFLENSMDRGAWRATVHGVTENQTGWMEHSATAAKGQKRLMISGHVYI